MNTEVHEQTGRLVISPLSPMMGAAITGVDLSQPIDADTLAARHQALRVMARQ